MRVLRPRPLPQPITISNFGSRGNCWERIHESSIHCGLTVLSDGINHFVCRRGGTEVDGSSISLFLENVSNLIG